jgi:hypothetical protein
MGVLMFYAYEVATDYAYYLCVHASKVVLEARFEQLLKDLGDAMDTYAVGTVHAATIEEALDKIRACDWKFTQKV